MKKLFCLFLVFALCLGFHAPISATNTSFSVEAVATELINDALAKPNEFQLPDLNGKNVYLCNAINPYTLDENSLVSCDDIEYYIVRTDDIFVACITLCYDNGTLLSACLDINVANILNTACSIEDPIQIVTEAGQIYVKTGSNTISSASRTSKASSENAISQAVGNPSCLTVKTQLSGIITNSVSPRASVTLAVPYVPQGSDPICWAAAAASFGRYYKGSAYSSYSAVQLATMIGVGPNPGTMADARKILTDIFGVSTTYSTTQLSSNTTISLLQQAKPILAGFSGSYNESGDAVGHMVVISGFDDSSSTLKFYVRGPNFSATKTVLLYSKSVAMEYYEGIIMWWDESAY